MNAKMRRVEEIKENILQVANSINNLWYNIYIYTDATYKHLKLKDSFTQKKLGQSLIIYICSVDSPRGRASATMRSRKSIVLFSFPLSSLAWNCHL
jgi:hypothetical protein